MYPQNHRVKLGMGGSKRQGGEVRGIGSLPELVSFRFRKRLQEIKWRMLREGLKHVPLASIHTDTCVILYIEMYTIIYYKHTF